MSLVESFQRPEGFPFSEEEFHNLKQQQLGLIASGGKQDEYDEWVLRGVPGRPFRPIVALGIFPTMVTEAPGYIFEPEFVVFDENHRPIFTYWRGASLLPFTARVAQYEARYFANVRGKELEIFKDNLGVCLRCILPTGIILFNRGQQEEEEHAFMMSPRFVPPSATYIHLIEQAKLHQQQ